MNVKRIKRNCFTAKGIVLSAGTQTWAGSRSNIESILLSNSLLSTCAFDFINLSTNCWTCWTCWRVLKLLNLLHGQGGSQDCWDDINFLQGFLPFLSFCTAFLMPLRSFRLHSYSFNPFGTVLQDFPQPAIAPLVCFHPQPATTHPIFC